MIFITLCYLVANNDTAIASNIFQDTVIYESSYKPFPDIKKLANIVRVNYRCFRNGRPLNDIFIIELDSAKTPAYMSMSYEGNMSMSNARITDVERINFIRIALNNISKDWGLANLHQIFISPSDFGEMFLQINREISKNKKRTNYTISSQFKNKNNKIISDISRILSDYNLCIKEVIIEDEILKYSRDEYIKIFNYSGEINTLPLVFYEPIRILLVIRNKE